MYKIISDANKLKKSDRNDLKTYSIYKKRIDDFNAFMEMWKYDNLKTLFKNDKYNLEPIKYFFFVSTFYFTFKYL